MLATPARRLTSLLTAAGLALTAAVTLPAAPALAATTITINGSGAGRTFDGIGAISGGGGNSRLLIDYPEPQRGQVLDYLFKPNYGAALQILKVEVGGDTNSTSGAEPSHSHLAGDLNCNRGYEWWLMEQAKARNPAIKLAGLAWGAPGYLGNGSFWSTDTVNYYLSWLDCAKNSHGLTIDYLGGWNERGHDKTWFKNLKSALTSHGYGNVKVIADDTNWNVADAAAADPAFAASVDIFSAHYVCGYRGAQSTCPSSASAVASGKTLWASENGSDDYNGGAAALARGINRDYIDGKMTGYLNWPLIASAYPNLPFPTMGVALADEPWSGAYSIGKNSWVMAHTTQFTEPGWRYLDSGSGFFGGNRANGSYVTMRSPSTGDYSVVAETLDATAAQTFTATVTGGLSATAVHVWSTLLGSTSPSDYLVHTADVTPAGGTFSVTLQPGRVYTISTTTGQGKGTATSPAASSLALPYSDNFDSYAVGREARYLSDQEGAFEVTACAAGRTGRCVRQMSPRAPIAWNTIGDPYSLLGDLGWSNYTVSSDVLLEKAGYVELLGHASWQLDFRPAAIDAYHFRLANAGSWSLLRTNLDQSVTTLRSGTTTAPGLNSWHRMALTFSGTTITAQVDGATVGTVTDTMWRVGQVGVATSQGETAQFDNLSVAAVAGPAPPTSGRLMGEGSGRCLDVPGQVTTNGTALLIWDCNGQPNQQWNLLANGSLQVYGNKCIDVPGHATAPGTAVVIWDCHGGLNQQWKYNATGSIVGIESGLCLDVFNGDTGNGSKVTLWSCNGSVNQKWTR